jgi:glycosyltransferase involved in cell wall biosynthesis
VWTQHNLLPHYFKSPEALACYQRWAAAADAVIHHTEWGRRVALDTYTYGPSTIHEVIPHGHWGHQYAPRSAEARALVELEEGWPSCAIRLAVVGSPREEKLLQLVVDAVAGCSRDDIQLVIRVDHGVVVPDDPRIIAEMGHVEEARYLRRMGGFDALVLPFSPTGMLTTGTAFDAIGRGIAALTSEWEFFDETFAGADIRYGTTTDDLRDCLEHLTAGELERSAEAMGDLRSRYEWGPIAERTFSLFELVGSRPS